MAQNNKFLTSFYDVATKYSTIANDFYKTLKICL